jgi:L-arabinose isomerase
MTRWVGGDNVFEIVTADPLGDKVSHLPVVRVDWKATPDFMAFALALWIDSTASANTVVALVTLFPKVFQ